jgi:hypothetical protein
MSARKRGRPDFDAGGAKISESGNGRANGAIGSRWRFRKLFSRIAASFRARELTMPSRRSERSEPAGIEFVCRPTFAARGKGFASVTPAIHENVR